MSHELAVYAVTETHTRPRRYPEKAHPYRSDFERDRDRIIHSQAFRRLEGKTQVFTPHINDHYRTRFTHSIEVSQIGRTLAKMLKLNESLTEAVCLAHDLGHSPFGHNGEEVLNEIMLEKGQSDGFEHNRQVIRIVELLEHPYPDFSGLNLMYQTVLALAKHRSPYDKPDPGDFSEPNCSLEGQIADIADRIAYNCHDLEDGLNGGLIDEKMLKKIELCRQAEKVVKSDRIKDDTSRRTRIAKTIIDILVSDVIKTSGDAIAEANITSPSEVCCISESMIKLSDDAEKSLCQLEKFLLENMYLHKTLTKTKKEIEKWLREVFRKFSSHPEKMPIHYRQLIDEQGLARTVCDYVSGMTDWYCRSMLEEI